MLRSFSFFKILGKKKILQEGAQTLPCPLPSSLLLPARCISVIYLPVFFLSFMPVPSDCTPKLSFPKFDCSLPPSSSLTWLVFPFQFPSLIFVNSELQSSNFRFIFQSYFPFPLSSFFNFMLQPFFSLLNIYFHPFLFAHNLVLQRLYLFFMSVSVCLPVPVDLFGFLLPACLRMPVCVCLPSCLCLPQLLPVCVCLPSSVCLCQSLSVSFCLFVCHCISICLCLCLCVCVSVSVAFFFLSFCENKNRMQSRLSCRGRAKTQDGMFLRQMDFPRSVPFSVHFTRNHFAVKLQSPVLLLRRVCPYSSVLSFRHFSTKQYRTCLGFLFQSLRSDTLTSRVFVYLCWKVKKKRLKVCKSSQDEEK